MYFKTTLISVLISLFYMIPGFILVKVKFASASHLKTLSAILTYVCGPIMIINAFLDLTYSLDNTIKMIEFFFVTLVLQLLFALLLFLILRRKMEDPKSRMLLIASIFGNVGFFGLPLIKSLFPTDAIVMVYSSIFVCSMNILAFTLGAFAMTRKKKYISIRAALLNPTIVGLYIALILYFCRVSGSMLHEFKEPINILAKMTTPLCMMMLGARLANMDFKGLFKRPFVYISCVLKQLIFPLFCYLLVYFIPFFDSTFKASILVLCACPSAAIISSIAEMYMVEQENAANVVMLSTLSCVITLPLLMMIL